MLCYLSVVCSFVFVFVVSLLYSQLCGFSGIASLCAEDEFIEVFWLIGPSLVVYFLCVSNLSCLSYRDWCDWSNSGIVKIVGNQWYWSYEVGAGDVVYDSYVTDFVSGADKPLRLDYNRCYDLVVTSSDVIHSFSLPDFNLKIDAVPGRLNEVFFVPDRMGVFVGYCSELCGAGHGYMPVVVEVTSAAVGQ